MTTKLGKHWLGQGCSVLWRHIVLLPLLDLGESPQRTPPCLGGESPTDTEQSRNLRRRRNFQGNALLHISKKLVNTFINAILHCVNHHVGF